MVRPWRAPRLRVDARRAPHRQPRRSRRPRGHGHRHHRLRGRGGPGRVPAGRRGRAGRGLPGRGGRTGPRARAGARARTGARARAGAAAPGPRAARAGSRSPSSRRPRSPSPSSRRPRSPRRRSRRPRSPRPRSRRPRSRRPRSRRPKSPKAEEPKAEEPKAEEPKAEEPAPETPSAGAAPADGEVAAQGVEDESAPADTAAPADPAPTAGTPPAPTDPAAPVESTPAPVEAAPPAEESPLAPTPALRDPAAPGWTWSGSSGRSALEGLVSRDGRTYLLNRGNTVGSGLAAGDPTTDEGPTGGGYGGTPSFGGWNVAGLQHYVPAAPPPAPLPDTRLLSPEQAEALRTVALRERVGWTVLAAAAQARGALAGATSEPTSDLSKLAGQLRDLGARGDASRPFASQAALASLLRLGGGRGARRRPRRVLLRDRPRRPARRPARRAARPRAVDPGRPRHHDLRGWPQRHRVAPHRPARPDDDPLPARPVRLGQRLVPHLRPLDLHRRRATSRPTSSAAPSTSPHVGGARRSGQPGPAAPSPSGRCACC